MDRRTLSKAKPLLGRETTEKLCDKLLEHFGRALSAEERLALTKEQNKRRHHLIQSIVIELNTHGRSIDALINQGQASQQELEELKGELDATVASIHDFLKRI